MDPKRPHPHQQLLEVMTFRQISLVSSRLVVPHRQPPMIHSEEIRLRLLPPRRYHNSKRPPIRLQPHPYNNLQQEAIWQP